MFTKELISKYLDEKKLLRQKHPTEDLYIYNYSKGVQFNRQWDEVTLACRGLILDSEMNIVSRPFGKFFNYEEPEAKIPVGVSFKVYDKLDGSLGVSYKVDGVPYIASRGSFDSVYALEATKLLHEKYKDSMDKMEDGKTYLFEFILQAEGEFNNRVVVDYEGMKDIILLGVVDNETGKDCPLVDIGIPIVEEIEWDGSAEDFQKLDIHNKEGGIFVFDNGDRFKVKFSEYVRLHRILTGINNIDLWKMKVYELDPKRHPEWEMTLDGILNKAPDEFYDWIHDTLRGFDEKVEEIDRKMRAIYEPMKHLEGKEFAYAIKDFDVFEKGLLFGIKKGGGRLYKTSILKSIRPEHSTPFAKD